MPVPDDPGVTGINQVTRGTVAVPRPCQATGQGLHPGVREAHGRDPPPRRVDGGVRDPLDDWIREDAAALAGNYRGLLKTQFEEI